MKRTEKAVVTGGDLNFYALLGVLRNGMLLQSDITAYLRKHGLSHGRFSLLLALVEAQGAPMAAAELAPALGRSRPAVLKMIGRLKSAGYLAQAGGAAGMRGGTYRLTEKAKRLIGAISPPYARRLSGFCGSLSDPEKIRLLELLGKLNVPEDRTMRAKQYERAAREKSALIRRLCRNGGVTDIDGVLSFLDDETDLPTTKIVDYYLGTVATAEGVKRIEHYLFHGTQIQRNYCTLFFSRRNEWSLVNRAYERGLVDYKQAYSR